MRRCEKEAGFSPSRQARREKLQRLGHRPPPGLWADGCMPWLALASDAGLLREIDVQRIRFRIVVEFHGLNRRSGNALWIVTLSSSVTTLKKRPSSSGASAQKR